ncbi:hypothetical protein GBF38_007795 [Nibea albiflora]|uniref:Uncharacterized protein n=1 Tax=Nibea albiflora TaxID=240163 RepID=A0ACB7EPG5_NIBAL|nr:hypothetical protein GBF38_007795 [Nibea albiflora]
MAEDSYLCFIFILQQSSVDANALLHFGKEEVNAVIHSSFNACQGLAASYIVDLLTIYEPLFNLRAFDSGPLVLALL